MVSDQVASHGSSNMEIGTSSNQELVAKSRSSKRKLVLLTIIPVMLLGVAAVFLLTLNDGSSEKLPPKALPLSAIIEGYFDRHSSIFNGTWVSDSEVLLKDQAENLCLFDINTRESKVILENDPAKSLSAGIQYELSADKKFIMIATTYTRLYRYSFIARYQIYDVEKKVAYPISSTLSNATDPLELQLVQWSPKGNAYAFVYLNNIFYRPSATSDTEYQLTNDGVFNYFYNGVPDWVYEEEVLGTNSAMWFSPDGQKLAYASFNDSLTPVMTIPYYGSAGSTKYQYPHPVSLRYPKAGRANPVVSLSLVDLPITPNPNAPATSNILHPPPDFVDQDPILSIVAWRDASSLVAVWYNRVQNSSRILLCRANSCTTLYKLDESNGWIEMERAPVFSADGKHMLLLLPKKDVTGSDAYPHITRLSTEDPDEPEVSLTSGPFSVQSIISWDTSDNEVYYTATLPQHPEQLHLFVVSDSLTPKSKQPECLSCRIKTSTGNQCTYVSVTASPSSLHFTVICMGPGPAESFVLKKEGRHLTSWDSNELIRRKLQEFQLPSVKYMWVPIERTDMKALVKLLLPPRLDTSGDTKYPLLVNVYGGPKSNLAVDIFKMDYNHYLTMNKSVILAYIDGRGSGLKGQKMLFAGYRRLGSVEIYDQINVTRYLQKALPYVDKTRTGIWGWSYGGYSTVMALEHDVNNVFKCGISVAPVTDWLYYDTIYTERYMGLPRIDDNMLGYIAASANSKVDNLKNKKFLLVHGTLDDNVHFQQSMMLSRALELKDVLFQQQSYPDEEHGLTGVRPHFYHTLTRFITECFHLNP